MDKILEVNHLNYNFANNQIFTDLNMNIKKGTINSIIGPNKSGKSTLIKILSGFYHTDNAVEVDNVILNNNTKEYYYNKIILINNKIKFSTTTVNNEIDEKYSRYNSTNVNTRYILINLIKLFSLNPLLKNNPNNLDQFSKIKLSILLSLSFKPQVLLFDLDELNLTFDNKKELFMILSELKQQGLTIIYTSNNSNDIVYTDYLYVLNNGNIAISGPVKLVIKEDQLLLKLGIELPFMIDLSLKLQFYNLLDKVVLSMKRLVNTLWK